MEKKDKIRIILGIVAFLAGLAMLVIVFILGYHLYMSEWTLGKEIKDNEIIKAVTHWGVSFLLKAIGLIFMTVIGSLLSNKGINLIFSEK